MVKNNKIVINELKLNETDMIIGINKEQNRLKLKARVLGDTFIFNKFIILNI